MSSLCSYCRKNVKINDCKIEGLNLILRKACFEDYQVMYKNIWSNEEIYKWMFFEPTFDDASAIERIKRTIAFQKNHYAYYIALKQTNEVIGFCGVNEFEPFKYEETGICISSLYQNKGYGKEVLKLLLDLVFNKLNGKYFKYSYIHNNSKSKHLALLFNFKYESEEVITRLWDKKEIIVEKLYLTKEEYIIHNM